MKSFQKSMFVFLSIMFFFSACDKKEEIQIQLAPQFVSTMIAKAQNIDLSFTYPAELSSAYDVVIKPQINGIIVEKFFQAGDLVKKGQILFLIEQDKLQAKLNLAYAKVLLARADFEHAKKDYERSKILYDKGIISQKQYDNVIANLNKTKANLTSANANLQSARIDLSYTEIKAPFDGIVGDAFVNIGNYVTPSSSKLVRLTKLNPIYADFYISDIDKLNIIRNTENGKWELDNLYAKLNLNGEFIRGKIHFIDSIIDTKSGTLKAKAIFDNNNSILLPGTFTTITSGGFVQKNAFKIPQIAIKQNANETYVLLVKEGRVTKALVHISYEDNEYAIIDKGLKNGDRIILDNFQKIRIGSQVQEIEVL